jgi:GDPmannose 4,6-dehydratase
MAVALITGITGQDGSYLADLLLEKGHDVHGLIRRSSTFNTGRIDHIYGHERLRLHYGDMTEPARLSAVLGEVRPDEIYHLAAQSHVRVSFDEPDYTGAVVGLGTQHLLEAVRRTCPRARVYYAGSSEMFGASPPPQSEETPFRPRSPYGCAKAYGYHLARHYRDRGLFVGCGILFNHTGPRRGETFVTRKVTRAAARISVGLQSRLALGNLDARRDWGFAGDYVRAMWLMLQADEPDDFVVATGESHSVRDLLDAAFGHVGLRWQDHVDLDPRLMRPTEVDALCGDASKAHRLLGWRPTVTFTGLVDMMVKAELETFGAAP